MKSLQISLCTTAIILGSAIVALSISGSIRYFDSFKIPYDPRGHATLLVRLLAGSAVSIPVSVVMLVLLLREMQIPRWFVLIGALSAVFSFNLPVGIGHDFSHAVFEECSNKYGKVVSLLGTIQALLLPVVFLLNRRTAAPTTETNSPA